MDITTISAPPATAAEDHFRRALAAFAAANEREQHGVELLCGGLLAMAEQMARIERAVMRDTR